MFKGFRFQRQIEVLPWLTLNFSKSGISATVGPEDLHFTLGKGGTYVYADMPGKGTYFRRKLSTMMEDVTGKDEAAATADSAKAKEGSGDDAATTTEAGSGIVEGKIKDFGFLERLVAFPEEVALADALKALHAGDFDQAYQKARQAASITDGAFLAGFLSFRYEDWEVAVKCFEHCLEHPEALGTMFNRFEAQVNAYLPVTDDLVVSLQPSPRDCLLALAEAHQQLGHVDQAIQYLQQLRQEHDAEDLVLRLLLAELYDSAYADNERVQHEIVKLAEGVVNDSPLHATLMFYLARALRRLGLMDGSRDTLTKALRKKKDYPSDLLAHLRYERALIYEKEGDAKKAQQEFEKIYASHPDLEDVAERLGLASAAGSLPAAASSPPLPSENAG